MEEDVSGMRNNRLAVLVITIAIIITGTLVFGIWEAHAGVV
jgi:hypothetical protein